MIFVHHWYSACDLLQLALGKGRPAEEAIDEEQSVIPEELPEKRQMMKHVKPGDRRTE